MFPPIGLHPVPPLSSPRLSSPHPGRPMVLTSSRRVRRQVDLSLEVPLHVALRGRQPLQEVVAGLVEHVQMDPLHGQDPRPQG